MAAATDPLAPMLQKRRADRPVRVPDLACGGWPTAIAGVMAAFPERRVDYTGVDINPDQAELASTLFEFPGNVETGCILEGNAWDLYPLPIAREQDLVFSGMNLHHGMPEELLYLALQLRELLAPDGLFLHGQPNACHRFGSPMGGGSDPEAASGRRCFRTRTMRRVDESGASLRG